MKGQCYQNLPYPTKALKSKAKPLFKNDGSHFTNSHRTFFDFTCKSNRNLVSSINSIPSWISLTYPPLIRKKTPKSFHCVRIPQTALPLRWPQSDLIEIETVDRVWVTTRKTFTNSLCHSIHPISFSLSGDLTPAPLKSSTFHRRGQNDDLLQTTKFVFKFSCCSEGKRRRKLQVRKFISLDGRIIMNVWFARLYIEFFTFPSLLLRWALEGKARCAGLCSPAEGRKGFCETDLKIWVLGIGASGAVWSDCSWCDGIVVAEIMELCKVGEEFVWMGSSF